MYKKGRANWMNLRKLRREHTLIFAHTASSAETQGGFASKTIRVGSGRVRSDRLGRPEESLREWPNRSFDWWFQFGTRLFLGLLPVSSGISTHIIATGIGCFFAHHAGKDFYFCFYFSYFSEFPLFFIFLFHFFSFFFGNFNQLCIFHIKHNIISYIFK